jgi:signal transduction histidine kinase
MIFENHFDSFLKAYSDRSPMDQKRVTYILLIKIGLLGLFVSLFLIHYIFGMHAVHFIADIGGVISFAVSIYLLKINKEKAGATLVIWSLVAMTFVYSTLVDYCATGPVQFLRIYVTMLCVMGILVLSISVFTSFGSYRLLSVIFGAMLTLQAYIIVQHNGGWGIVTSEMWAYYFIALMTASLATLITHFISNLNRAMFAQNQQHAEIIKQHNLVLLQTVESQTHELKETNARLNDFAHIASHDLREPLRSISGFSTLLSEHLKQKGIDDKESLELLQFIVSGVRRMNDLIKDILTFSVMSKNKRHQAFEDINLQGLVQQLELDLHASLKTSHAKLEYANLPVIYGQRSLVNQLLLNLISNALHYSRKELNPHIIVSAYYQDDRIVVTVKDNGMGVPYDMRDKIFEPHFSHHQHRGAESTGMGLSICKRIVQFHKGDIWVESDGRTGTTFYCSFPAGTNILLTEETHLQSAQD